MSWFMVGTAAVTTAVSLYSSNQAAGASAKAAGAQSKAENEAIIRQNMNLMVRNHYKAGMMNLQLGLQKKQAIQKGFDTTVVGEAALGAATASQAASGTIGSSTDVVLTDINMKVGEAKAQQREEYVMDLTNFNNELEGLSLSAQGEVQHARKYEYNGPTGNQMLMGALAQGIGSFASQYANSSMRLGLGNAPSTGGLSTMQNPFMGSRT